MQEQINHTKQNIEMCLNLNTTHIEIAAPSPSTAVQAVKNFQVENISLKEPQHENVNKNLHEIDSSHLHKQSLENELATTEISVKSTSLLSESKNTEPVALPEPKLEQKEETEIPKNQNSETPKEVPKKPTATSDIETDFNSDSDLELPTPKLKLKPKPKQEKSESIEITLGSDLKSSSAASEDACFLTDSEDDRVKLEMQEEEEKNVSEVKGIHQIWHPNSFCFLFFRPFFDSCCCPGLCS